jgi:hypothetical protein
MPTFAEAPMIRCQIPNIVETLKPDIVIYNEGVFPLGPENGSIINDDFISNYCSDDGYTGFDFDETKAILAEAQETYPDIEWHLGAIKYPAGMRAEDAYTFAVSNFEDYGIELEVGDIIFPSEADVFHLESAADEIDELVNSLKPDEGISSNWWDFGATQNYIEQRLHPDVNTVTRSRRFAVCYGTMGYYQSVAQNFVSQKYTNTRLVELRTYHYPWFRIGKYLDLRCIMLRRQRNYWNDYMIGHWEQIEETRNGTFKESVMIRPTLTGNYRYVKYIDTEHPKSIQKHTCYI